MRVLRLVMCAAVLLVPQADGSRDLALVGGTVYTSPAAAPMADAVIVVHDGRLAAVGKRGEVVPPANARVLDCAGTVITAGFWNGHVHIFTPGLLHAGAAAPAELTGELDAMFNRWGFTTVFDIASVLDNTLALARRIDAGEVRGPRILTAGEPLWTKPPVYVRDFLEAQHIAMAPVTTSDEAIARVRDLAARGASGIKLFTGSLQSDGVAGMPLDIAQAAATEAHRHGLPVFAHPQNTQGLETAMAAGVDVLAHTTPDSPEWTPALVARLVTRRMALMPTLTLFDFEARKGAVPDQEIERWLMRMVAELRAFAAGGGEVVFGTDAGYSTHYDTEMEFQLMGEAGLDYRAILASLTTTPARRFGAGAHAGRVERGFDADLTVIEGDPAKDVRNYARVRYTIRSGRVIYQRP